jgi:signal transduction histidine kinase/ActR/RegA family two-component response regulator
MMSIIRSIDNVINVMASREPNPINQARVRMLVYIIFSYLFYTGVLVVAYVIDWNLLRLLRVLIIFVSVFLLFGVVRYTKAWRLVSHFIIFTLTLAVWSNVWIYIQGINVATLQYVWLAIVLSFYMHGLKWGWLYSIVNIFPVLAFSFIEYSQYNYLLNNLQSIYDAQPIRHSVYLFVLIFDFFIIIFLHHYFFKTFDRNIISLTNAKNELNDLNEKLNKTVVDVEKLSNARMDFLSTMSHELRTPLNGVIGISNALASQNPREDQKENLAVLGFSAENLLSLINDILDFNKLDSENVELEHIPFHLATHIRNNCASLKMKAEEKLLDFNMSISKDIEDKIVFSDPTRLTQVLLNLLNNAIKFTEKGAVSLNVYALKSDKSDMAVRFIIEDTGIGIKPDKQKNIFEAFTQASSSTNRNYGGTGLGLPIVKKVLSMYNTHVDLVSIPQVGSKFFFDIDFKYEVANSSTILKPKTVKSQLKQLKVLVAEDNAINILVIKKALEQWGIEADIAENGIIALQKLEQTNYNVILMDLYMPDMDGYEAASLIRKMTDINKANIAIIALTATVNDTIIERVIEVGMDDYLSKPFHPDHLFDKLQKLNVNN